MGLTGRSYESNGGQSLPCDSLPYDSMSPASTVVVNAGVEQAQWYAIQTRPRHEKTLVAELEQKGITTYLPLIAETHCWSDRRKVVQVPLFSCYAFISAVLRPAVRLQVLRVWGVLSFVGPRREPMTIPAKQIEDVQRLLACNRPFASIPFLKVGQRVRILGGCLDGMEGILVDRRGNRRLVISLESIERSLSFSIEDYRVAPI